MNDVTLQQQVEAATGYDQFFVPALFEQWASRMAEAAGVEPGDSVLDVACGTGVLARELKKRVGSDGSVVGLDVNPGMLAVAARRGPDITWQEGAAESIPFENRSFDAVVSQFGLMFFVDRERALREMWRVLARGGTLAMAVWDSLEHTPAYAGEVDLFERMVGPAAAGVLRAPFSLGNPTALRDLFVQAEIPSPMVTTQRGRAHFASIRAMIEADIKAWLPLAGIALTEDQTSAVVTEAERTLGDFVEPDGTVAFDAPAHIVTAVK